MNKKPVISDDPMYQLLRDGNIEEFNSKKQGGEFYDLQFCDFRSIDLKGLNAAGIDFRNAYFRQTDLKGIDFRGALLEGASINGAKISGAYFPNNITAQEILLSLEHGTRLRVVQKKK
ncbi:MAG: pentapeptide repeat-containing protein [gamma proteobacterium symbiont of Taylorina sp.]|nr:pentapeptide repeat-containing protein [gamma proteobacterium symbiont of Taylorina sp.]